MTDHERIVISSADLRSQDPSQQTRPAASETKAWTIGNIVLLFCAVLVLTALLSAGLWVAHIESQEVAAMANAPSNVPAFSGPVNACLVVDRSGSMAGAPLADAKEAAKDFIKCLKPDDEASVVDFGSEVHVACPGQQIGNDGPLLGAIDNIACNGSTALWDAGIEGIDILSSAEEGRARVLVLLTDGMNNASQNSVETLIDKAKSAKVVVHTVTLGTIADRATLKRVADETGGVYNHAQSSRQLRGIYQNLGKRLHKASP